MRGWPSLAGPSSLMRELQAQRQQGGEQLREVLYTHFWLPNTCLCPNVSTLCMCMCVCVFGGGDEALPSTLVVLVVDKPVMGYSMSL